MQHEIRERKRKDQRGLLKKNTASARQAVNVKGFQPKNATAADAVDLSGSTNAVLTALDAVPDDDAGEEEQDVYEEVLEEEDGTTARLEPEAWDG